MSLYSRIYRKILWELGRYRERSFFRRKFLNGSDLIKARKTGVPVGIAKCSDGGIILHPDDRIGFPDLLLEVLYNEVYLKDFYQPKSGDTVIDAGANVGLFSIQVAKLCSNCTVYAFEPFEENFRLLNENLTNHGLANVRAFNVALSSFDGEATILNVGARSQDHRITTNNEEIERGTKTKTISLQGLFDTIGHSRIAMFKCDIEGSEMDVFHDATVEQLDLIDQFVIEFHDNLRPGIFRLLHDRFQKTHEMKYNPDRIGNCGLIYGTRRS